MNDCDEIHGREDEKKTGIDPSVRAVSRREFLRLAAVAGGAVGVGGALGGILASCGEAEETTTTAGATTTASAGATTTASQPTTTVSTGPESGRPIKLGYVVPVTGPLAAFSTAAKWAEDHFAKAIGDGIVMGDGKKHSFEVLLRDTQSSSDRAAQVTGDLIQNDKVDLVMAAVTPDTINPAGDVAEAMACPMISNWSEWHAFTMGRGATPDKPPFNWTYTYSFDDVLTTVNYVGALQQVPSNKVVGLVAANDPDGNNWVEWGPPILEDGGFKVITTDQYTPLSEDYTAQITKLKSEGCELLIAVMITPDFTNFWTQALQQGLNPKVAFGHKGLIFPEGVIALGPIGINLSTAGTWTPRSKFIDSLTGMSCRELADEYEAFSGNQWSEAVIILVLFEWATDLFKRVKSVDDKQEIVSAIKTTKLDTIIGQIDFTAPVSEQSHHPHPNACTPPQACGQWVKATSGKWPIDKVLVFTTDPDIVELDATLQPIEYS